MCGAIRTPNVRSQKPEARSQEPGARSQKPGARSQKPEARSQKPGARSQEPGARSQEPGARSQEPEARSQKLESLQRTCVSSLRQMWARASVQIDSTWDSFRAERRCEEPFWLPASGFFQLSEVGRQNSDFWGPGGRMLKCSYAFRVATRPRGVRWRKPIWMR